MKIHFFDNTAASSFYFCKYLRSSGIDAKLFLETGEKYWTPEFENSSCKEESPDWIVRIPTLRPYRPIQLKGSIEKISKCDIIHCFGFGPAFFRKQKTPYVFQSYGSDLSEFPFRNTLKYLIDRRKHGLIKLKSLIGISYNFLSAYMQREGLKKAAKVLYGMPFQFPFVKELGLTNYAWLPWLYDVNQWKNVVDRGKIEELTNKYSKYDLIFFAPSRHEWNKDYVTYKGNDMLIKAFARFIKNTEKNILLLLTKKGGFNKAKKLISNLRIEDHVEYFDALPKKEFYEYLSVKNFVVFDQFGPISGLGGCSRDAMSCSRPLITHFNKVEFEGYYSTSPPIFNAYSEETILKQMIRISEMPSEKLWEIGKQNRECLFKEHHYKNIIYKYIELYEEIIKNEK